MLQAVKKPWDEMWQATLVLSVIGLITGIASMTIFYYRAPVLIRHNAILTLISFTAILILTIFKNTRNPSLTNFLWLMLTAAGLWAIWINHDYYVKSGRVFDLFIGLKLIALLVALFIPVRRWIGWSTLAAAEAVGLIRYFTWPENIRDGLSIQEPMMTTLIIAIAGLLYHYRLKFISIQRRAVLIEAKAEMLQRFAHLLINAQHLANTPLQTLQNTSKVLKTKHPETLESLDLLDRSLNRLRDIVQLFSQFDSFISWKNLNIPDTLEDFRKQANELFNGKH